MEIPAFVHFAEPVPSLDIQAGDDVWVTRDSATLVRRLDFNQVHLQLHLARPVELPDGGLTADSVRLEKLIFVDSFGMTISHSSSGATRVLHAASISVNLGVALGARKYQDRAVLSMPVNLS